MYLQQSRTRGHSGKTKIQQLSAVLGQHVGDVGWSNELGAPRMSASRLRSQISRDHRRCVNLAHAEARERVEKPASAFDRALTSAKSKVICASPRLRSGVGSRPSRVPKAKSSRAKDRKSVV